MSLAMALVDARVLAAALVIIHDHPVEHFAVHHHHLDVLRAHHRRGTVRSPLEQTCGERRGRRCEHVHAGRYGAQPRIEVIREAIGEAIREAIRECIAHLSRQKSRPGRVRR